MVVLLLVMSLMVFSLLHLEPGSIVKNLLGTRPVSPAAVAQIRAQYHLDDPFLTQYWIWLRHALSGDFGTSVQSGTSVAHTIGARCALTLELLGFSFVLGAAFSIPAGVLAGFNRGRNADRLTVIASIVGVSAPPFAVALLLLYALANDLSLFPVFGAGTGFFSRLDHLFLPALTLALSFGGFLVKITRAAVIQEVDQDYVTFARARGLSEPQVLALVLRNACLPVLTSMGLALAYLIGSTVVVEQAFSLPGIGSLLNDAVTFKDVPVVQGLTLLIAAAIALTALIVDLAYLALDPQLRNSMTGRR